MHIMLVLNTIIMVFCFLGCESSVLSKALPGKNHKLLSQALQRHVADGLVDYEAISKDSDFISYLDWLATADTSDFETREEGLAFWINAYNALAVRGVVKNYPLKRVIDAAGFFKEQKHPVAKGHLTLNQVEKQFIFECLWTNHTLENRSSRSSLPGNLGVLC